MLQCAAIWNMLLIILYVGGLGATSMPNLLGGKPTPNLKAHAQMVIGIKTSIQELLTVYGKNKNSHICQFSLWNQRLYFKMKDFSKLCCL